MVHTRHTVDTYGMMVRINIEWYGLQITVWSHLDTYKTWLLRIFITIELIPFSPFQIQALSAHLSQPRSLAWTACAAWLVGQRSVPSENQDQWRITHTRGWHWASTLTFLVAGYCSRIFALANLYAVIKVCPMCRMRILTALGLISAEGQLTGGQTHAFFKSGMLSCTWVVWLVKLVWFVDCAETAATKARITMLKNCMVILFGW